MSKKPAKFAWAIVVAFVAGLAVMTVPRAASAADECLTEPKGPTPAGKHWRYHIERGTGRHCWYLRSQDDATASTTQDQSAAADDDASSTQDQVQSARDQAPSSKPAAKTIETPATRSISNARAELPAKMPVDDGSAAVPAPRPVPTTTAANTSVFPDPSTALAAKPAVIASPATDASSVPSSDTNANTQPDTTASITPAAVPSAAPTTQAGPLGNRHLGSIPMLLLVAFGALGLAGLTGSLVYRLARFRRARPEDRWSRSVPAPARRRRPTPAHPEPVQETFEQETFEQEALEQDDLQRDNVERETLEQAIFEQRNIVDEYAPKRPARRSVAQENWFQPRAEVSRDEPRTGDINVKREQIEAYLAQLTRQLQADLQATARAE